jgi:cell division protein ZapE
MLDAYEKTLAERGFVADAAQMAAAQSLQALHAALLYFKARRANPLSRLIARPRPPRGVYLWGGVGRGKSFLMDAFFNTLPYRRKKRIHFHAFMQHIHAELGRFKGQPDPMLEVAKSIARETRLLCFDEFHVADIADAMILARLLTGLKNEGVVLVMTSNYPPDGLYPNGLHRESFLPAIALLKKELEILQVDAGIDYRLRALEQVAVYHFPADAAADARMLAYFRQMAGESGISGGTITILGREIPVRMRAKEIIWFDFTQLCDGPRSQNDYLEIARRYPTVLLSSIPRMGPAHSAQARRLTWLVDVFYDHGIKLIITAQCAAEALYPEGAQASEFLRTVSRLTEMRSKEYLTASVRHS